MKRKTAKLIVEVVVEFAQRNALDQPDVPQDEVSEDRVLGWMLEAIDGLIKSHKMYPTEVEIEMEDLATHIIQYMSQSSAENIFGEDFCDTLLTKHFNKFAHETNS